MGNKPVQVKIYRVEHDVKRVFYILPEDLEELYDFAQSLQRKAGHALAERLGKRNGNQ